MSKKVDTNNVRLDVVKGNRVAGDETVSGIVHVIRDEAEVDKFREGEILVAAEVPQHWNDLFAMAKAIVTETDLLPGHVADLAQSSALPVVTGVCGCTNNLRSGDIVKILPDGTIRRLPDLRAPDSQMRVSVPAAVRARQLACQVVGLKGGSPASGSVVSLNVVKQSPRTQSSQSGEQIDNDNESRKMG